jgi:hypothetical protein
MLTTKMAATLNHAINQVLTMTNYNLEGSAWQIDGDPDAWYVIFNTPPEEATPATMQVMHVEVLFHDGGVVASLLKNENISDRRASRMMDLLMDAINISDDDDDEELTDIDEDPMTPEVNS